MPLGVIHTFDCYMVPPEGCTTTGLGQGGIMCYTVIGLLQGAIRSYKVFGLLRGAIICMSR